MHFPPPILAFSTLWRWRVHVKSSNAPSAGDPGEPTRQCTFGVATAKLLWEPNRNHARLKKLRLQERSLSKVSRLLCD